MAGGEIGSCRIKEKRVSRRLHNALLLFQFLDVLRDYQLVGKAHKALL